jgi:hypothetical protein
MQKMAIDFLKFFVIYGILIFLFAIIGNILFVGNIKEYSSFLNSVLTVITVSLGNFDFS